MLASKRNSNSPPKIFAGAEVNCGSLGPPQAAFLFLLIKERHILFEKVYLALILPAVLAQVIYMQVNSLTQISQVVKHLLKSTEQPGAAGTWLHVDITHLELIGPDQLAKFRLDCKQDTLGGEWGRSQGNVKIAQEPILKEYGCI